jgi:DNA-binding beta-propeller fold protein YncE
MKRNRAIMLALFGVFALKAHSTDTAPLKLVTTYEFPSDVKGRFDHLIVDVPGRRLFTAAMEDKSVDVFQVDSGKLIYTIQGIEKPHALLYRQDINRLYVTDGEAGDLKIFDGKTYKLLMTVKLLVGADGIGYDPATKYLYVVNGGKDAKVSYSMISVIDSTSGKKLADIKVDGDTLEALTLEKSSPRMYVNNRGKNQVEIIDRNTLRVLASWPVTLGTGNDPIALDEDNHRLYIACRSGQIVVFDTQTGKELQALAIGPSGKAGGEWVDDLVFDPKTKRLYAPCGGTATVDVYEEIDPDHYRSLGKVASGLLGKTGRLAPELNRYFVTVPQHENKNAEVLVYQVQ